jgi:hypothetical protein
MIPYDLACEKASFIKDLCQPGLLPEGPPPQMSVSDEDLNVVRTVVHWLYTGDLSCPPNAGLPLAHFLATHRLASRWGMPELVKLLSETLPRTFAPQRGRPCREPVVDERGWDFDPESGFGKRTLDLLFKYLHTHPGRLRRGLDTMPEHIERSLRERRRPDPPRSSLARRICDAGGPSPQTLDVVLRVFSSPDHTQRMTRVLSYFPPFGEIFRSDLRRGLDEARAGLDRSTRCPCGEEPSPRDDAPEQHLQFVVEGDRYRFTSDPPPAASLRKLARYSLRALRWLKTTCATVRHSQLTMLPWMSMVADVWVQSYLSESGMVPDDASTADLKFYDIPYTFPPARLGPTVICLVYTAVMFIGYLRSVFSSISLKGERTPDLLIMHDDMVSIFKGLDDRICAMVQAEQILNISRS